VLGTDCPIFDTARMLKSLAAARLDAETRERIYSRNAHHLFARAA
jgi:predicted TIM-barrel fold metal-dependent hydrolase